MLITIIFSMLCPFHVMYGVVGNSGHAGKEREKGDKQRMHHVIVPQTTVFPSPLNGHVLRQNSSAKGGSSSVPSLPADHITAFTLSLQSCPATVKANVKYQKWGEIFY